MRACGARRLRVLALAFGLAPLASFAEGPVTLSPDQLRVIAGQSAQRGLSGQALQMADALLLRDADDLQAHLIRSRAARDLGEFTIAREAAQQAWRLAATDAEKYAASLAMAQAQASDKKRTRAQVWLRRAAHHAPDEVSRRVAERDYRYVRSRNPWSTQFSVTIAPRSNINNGSTEDVVTITIDDHPFPFQLQGTARALSGMEYALGASLRYRLAQTPRSRTDLSFGASYRTYTLSDKAEEIAPSAEGSDFASGRVFAGLTREELFLDGRLGLSLDLAVGRNTYGGAPLEDHVRAGARLRYSVTPRLAVQGGVWRRTAQGHGDRPDNSGWTVSADLFTMLKTRDRLGLSLSHGWNEGAADYLTYESTRVAIRYTLDEPVWNTALSFGLGYTAKSHPESVYSADGRIENSADISMTARFDQVDYYGFVPQVTLSARRTDSNISLYDSEDFGLSVGIRSAF